MIQPSEIATRTVIVAVMFAVLSHWLPEGTTIVHVGFAVGFAIHPGNRPPSSPEASGSSARRVRG